MKDYPLDGIAGADVLDIGGYDGWAAARALDNGAKSATVVDNAEWRQYEWPKFDEIPGVRYVSMDFMDWHEPADVVICFNVIYHLRSPVFALHHLRTLTRDRLLLKTSFVPEEDGPWRYYPDGMGHPNQTVWWRPSKRGLEESLRAVGFHTIGGMEEEGDHLAWVCR